MRNPRKTFPLSPFEPPSADPRAPLLNLPAELVPDLPLPVTLWLAIEGAPARVQLTTRSSHDHGAEALCPERSLADVIVFEREEFRALVTAAEADRMWRKDLLGLCFDKWRRPDHRLTVADALAGANPDPQHWSLERVLIRLGATIERVELGDESQQQQHALSAAA
ncbi:MAG TPA: hypothetical protein VJV78_25620 [Polyangiales bacterium]|nr:hypothetical protein [Polyangiales bacterium]